MKKNLIFGFLALALVVVFTSSCKTTTYSKASVDDVAFIKLMSSSTLAGKQVQVTINDETSFSAKVNKLRTSPLKQKTYRIASGRKNIKIYSKGRLLWNQDVFVSQQSTLVIVL